MSSGYWLGVDLGGTKILAGLFDADLRLVARAKQPTKPEQGPPAVAARLAACVDAVLTEAGVGAGEVRGLGVGVPGQVRLGTGVVKFAPNLDWREVDLAPLLPPGWGWPVTVENDVRMGTYGEFACGAARGARHVFGVFVGTGVGGGLILNGDLFTGFNGHAGEVGHTVAHWRRGTTLEQIAGRKYMMRRAKRELGDAPKRVRKEWKNIDLAAVRSSELADYYQKADPVAVRLVDDAARALAATVGGVVNFLSPEVVVVGGGVAGALGQPFVDRIWEVAQRYILPGAGDGVRCVPAALGDDAGIIGSAAYARQRV